MEILIFPEGKLKESFRGFAPDDCVECGATIRHGFDRYFQRNDLTDGSIPKDLQSVLLGVTYDAVCGPCGDRLLQRDSL
jgi:hypothetical protein